jgi:copper chaperone CopZ
MPAALSHGLGHADRSALRSPVHRALAVLLLTVLAACGERTPPVSGVNADPVQRVVFSVEGMHCDGCVRAITAKSGEVQGVRSCTVSLADGTAVVELQGTEAESAFIDAVTRMGYTVAKKPAALSPAP